MLILTRRIGETLVVGDEIQVKVLSIRGSQVRIGITAPKGIGVYRQEVYEKQRREAKHSGASVREKKTGPTIS